MEILDFGLESELFVFVFSFQSEDLIVGLFGNSLALIGGSVEPLCFLVGGLDVFAVTGVNTILISHFLSHDIDLLSEHLILSLQIVVIFQIFIKLVFHDFDQGGVFLDFGGSWSDLFEVFLLFNELIASLLVLILKNHKTSKN